ncbi:iron-containing alcohol dehydrogenase [bacterium]|nr:iron-containing alcohol dehydrogenase [bacterium]
MQLQEKAKQLIQQFKEQKYAFGFDRLKQTGDFANQCGKKPIVVANHSAWLKPTVDEITQSIRDMGLSIAGDLIVPGSRPNTPQEDVYRLESYILHHQPDSLVAIGAGSQIDAVKGANVLACLGKEHSAEIDTYFGTNCVSGALEKTGKTLLPLIAVQTASSSAAHLTKYSNITDMASGQKKLIVDTAVVPDYAVFDYAVTKSMPIELTIDGALDGISHSLEVFYGAKGETFEQLKDIALTGIELIVNYAPKLQDDPQNTEAREALGLATDLGGYSIMVGGTNGAHLTSFSLVDATSHGRACGMMNPYYTVFFAPAIEEKLRLVGEVYKRAGYIDANLDSLKGRELGLAVAEGMVAFEKALHAPTTLSELPGFSDAHIERALNAAKNPQLEMKLKNMPIALDASMVDGYMAPVLQAAKTGDFSLIRTMD